MFVTGIHLPRGYSRRAAPAKRVTPRGGFVFNGVKMPNAAMSYEMFSNGGGQMKEDDRRKKKKKRPYDQDTLKSRLSKGGY